MAIIVQPIFFGDKFSTKYFQILGIKTVAFPRSLRCLIILNAIRVIILLDSFHFFFLQISKQGIQLVLTKIRMVREKKRKHVFRNLLFAHCAKYTMFEPRNFHKHCFLFFLGRMSYLKEIENNCYAKFWGCKQDLLWAIPNWRIGGHSFSWVLFLPRWFKGSVAFKPLRKKEHP